MEDIKNTQIEEGETQVIDDKKDENINNVEDKKKDEKLFTQDEVNRIVQDRVQREKDKNNTLSDNLSDRELNLIKRELKSDCRESLSEKGLPSEYIELFNGSTKDELNNFISLISKVHDSIVDKLKKESDNRFNAHTPPDSKSPRFDPIAAAFRR